MALSARERGAPAAHLGVQSVGQAGDELGQPGLGDHTPDLLVIGFRRTVGEVVPHAPGQDRCQVLAEALVAHRTAGGARGGLDETVARALVDARIDPTDPSVNLTSDTWRNP
ncbi:hypothetical protein GCM10009603_49460 [Nocardiopsis exhalans]